MHAVIHGFAYNTNSVAERLTCLPRIQQIRDYEERKPKQGVDMIPIR
jgi:hypothetical protein